MKFTRHALARAAVLAALAATALPAAAQLKAEVIHWWTSGGESAAVKTLAEAYKAQGGVWVDTAIALGMNALRAFGVTTGGFAGISAMAAFAAATIGWRLSRRVDETPSATPAQPATP